MLNGCNNLPPAAPGLRCGEPPLSPPCLRDISPLDWERQAYRAHAREITTGLTVIHIPESDKQILREIGSVAPDLEIDGLVDVARAELERRQREGLVLEVHEEGFRLVKEAVQKGTDEQTPKKKVRWFKGLGQVSTGAAFHSRTLPWPLVL
jgi:hypothetical protein